MHFEGKLAFRAHFEQLLGISHPLVSDRDHYLSHRKILYVRANSKPCQFVTAIVLHFASQEDRTAWLHHTNMSTDPGQPSLRLLNPDSTEYCRLHYDVRTGGPLGVEQRFLRFNAEDDAIAMAVYAVEL